MTVINGIDAPLSPTEKTLIQYLREHKYKHVHLRFQDHKLFLFEGTVMENHLEVDRAVRKGRYESIEVRKENGEIVQIIRTIKKRF